MPIQTRLLEIAIAKQAEPVLRRKVRSLVKLDFEVKKEEFLKTYDEHPVTEELAAGPDLPRGMVGGASSGGNLYSLLGFDESEEPERVLRDYLDENIKLDQTRKGEIQGDKIVFKTPVKIPTVEQVNAAMALAVPLEWSKRGFTELISRGISGLPYYLFSLTRRLKGSRSGTAIEVPNKLRVGPAAPIPYIGPLLAGLKDLITHGGSKTE